MKVFPEKLRKFAWNSKKSQHWETEIVTSASGMTRTLTSQLYPSWNIEANYNKLTDAEARELFGFYALLKGAQEAFFWLDPEDNYVYNQSLPKNIDGSYQCVMLMGEYAEPVERVELFHVYVNGAVLDKSRYKESNGSIKITPPPNEGSIVKADYRYYWKVRFKDSGLEIKRIFNNTNRATLKMVSAR